MAKLIAIKGFQIPETCISCPMQFGGWCGVSPPEIDERVAETVDEAWRQKRPEWCPLVEVEVPQMRAETERGALKPCPFCGCDRVWMRAVEYDPCINIIRCPDCGMEFTTPAWHKGHKSNNRNRTAEAWNRRTENGE